MTTQVNGNDNANLVSENIINLFKKFVEQIGIHDFKINIEPGSIKGDNYLGIIAKIEVNGKDKNDKSVDKNYIIKSAPRSEGFRNLAPIRLAYEREIYMYNVVLPEFMSFQNERKVKSPFNSFAKCLQTSFEDKDEALIMEDMKQYGFIMQNRHLPLSYPHVELVIKELAKLHSFSFAIKDQKPDLFKQLAEFMEKSFMEEMNKEQFTKHAEAIYGKARLSLDPVKDAEALKKFNAYADLINEDLWVLLSVKEAGDYAVIRHGDCWTNNFLFAYDDKETPNEPSSVCFLDWQISCLGSPVLDLLYFIFSCSDKKLRDNHYDDLLKLYHDQLRSFTAELGSDIDKIFPYSVLLEHMLKFGRYGLAIATMLIHLMTSESEEVPDMTQIFDQYEEDDLMKAFSYASKNEAYYHVRIRDVILDMVDKNYI